MRENKRKRTKVSKVHKNRVDMITGYYESTLYRLASMHGIRADFETSLPTQYQLSSAIVLITDYSICIDVQYVRVM